MEEVLSNLFLASVAINLPIALVLALMTRDTLGELLEGNQRHVERNHVPTTSDEAASTLVVSCPMAQRTPRRLWPIRMTDRVSEVSQLGNQVQNCADGTAVLDTDIGHLTQSHDVETIVVIGHTDCEIVAKAYDEYVASDRTIPDGIDNRITPLVSIIRDAIESEEVATDCPRETLFHRLVEYNVTRQVTFLAAHESVTATVAGYVYDDDGAYWSFPGKPYLVSLDGNRDNETLRSCIPEDTDVAVDSILH